MSQFFRNDRQSGTDEALSEEIRGCGKEILYILLHFGSLAGKIINHRSRRILTLWSRAAGLAAAAPAAASPRIALHQSTELKGNRKVQQNSGP